MGLTRGQSASTILIRADTSSVRYTFDVSGRVRRGRYTESSDRIESGRHVTGLIPRRGGVDEYRFTGTITSFEVDRGSATVAINGRRVSDPAGTGGATGSGSGSTADYSLVQGRRCLPITPLSGSRPVEQFYGYQLPAGTWVAETPAPDHGGPYYSSTGTNALQRHDTSILFLYDGPGGLSLVIVHGKVGRSPAEGGSATFTFRGLPADGEWVIKDDRYLDPRTGHIAPTNNDRWDVDGRVQTVAWTWGLHGTDGGAFRGLDSPVDLTIVPAFNGRARRLRRNYPGRVIDWQVLSGSLQNPTRRSLDMTEPVTIRSGSCD